MSSFIPTKCVDTICGDEKTLFRVDIYTLQKLVFFFLNYKSIKNRELEISLTTIF